MPQDEITLIKGTVSDGQGSALAGVSVIVKNSNRGTITDYNGQYVLSVLPGDKYLVFSLAGFESREVKIGKQKIINILQILGA